MKKEYNCDVTPQNTPYFLQRKILVSVSTGMLILNLMVFACLLPEIRAVTLGFAAVFSVYLPLQLLDKRRMAWT